MSARSSSSTAQTTQQLPRGKYPTLIRPDVGLQSQQFVQKRGLLSSSSSRSWGVIARSTAQPSKSQKQLKVRSIRRSLRLVCSQDAHEVLTHPLVFYGLGHCEYVGSSGQIYPFRRQPRDLVCLPHGLRRRTNALRATVTLPDSRLVHNHSPSTCILPAAAVPDPFVHIIMPQIAFALSVTWSCSL